MDLHPEYETIIPSMRTRPYSLIESIIYPSTTFCNRCRNADPLSFSLLLLVTGGTDGPGGLAAETDAEATIGSPTEIRAGAEGRAFIARVGDEVRAERVTGASDEDEGDVRDIERAEGRT